MNSKEKEKFRKHLNEFSREKLIGWASAIAFIMLMKSVDDKLADELLEMSDICDDVIREKE